MEYLEQVGVPSFLGPAAPESRADKPGMTINMTAIATNFGEIEMGLFARKPRRLAFPWAVTERDGCIGLG
jgi:hypothetical protein